MWNRKFSWITGAYSGATDEMCKNWCDLVPSSNLVGVSVKNSGFYDARCYCYFRVGIPPSSSLQMYNPSVDDTRVNIGIGTVKGSDGNGVLTCYKKV
jgi:hypothetical protein